MSTHFCKIRKPAYRLKQALGLEELERKYANFIEEAYNIKYTDHSLSDILYYEAHKLKRMILNIKSKNPIV